MIDLQSAKSHKGSNKLKIGKCNLRLSSDVTSKEATLQVVYDVLKLTPFLQAFQVTADVPEIYKARVLGPLLNSNRSVQIQDEQQNAHSHLSIQRHTSIRPESVMKSLKNHLLRRDSRILCHLGHSWRIQERFTDVNVNKLHQPWRSFAAIINKCHHGKTSYTVFDIRNSESYKEYYAIASGKIPPKTKGSKKKADIDATTKQKPPTFPKEKKWKRYWKRKRKRQKVKDNHRRRLTKLGNLKKSPREALKDSQLSNDDKNDDDENAQDDEDDDKNDDDENAQDDDDEAQTESEDDGDDFIHPKLTTHDDETTHEEETDEDDTFDPIVHTPSYVSSSDDKDNDNEVEGMDVEREKLDEDAIYVQATQEIEDTHVTLTPVNPDGQQQSSSVSSGFVSNMLNPNQDTGVDAIFGHNAQATSLIDIPVTAIAEPSFFAPTNRPPTPTPLFIQLQQPPILTPATTPSSSLQNLPDFGSLFGFDNRLKALEDNFSEFKQTNQYAEALSSIPGIVDQYLANKMKEAVDVAVQLKLQSI
ncbi:hypothetical protein Tco_0640211 [Tanacetum coccineum]